MEKMADSFINGVTRVIGYNFLLYEALCFTSSLDASLVNAMNPALIVCCAALFLKETLTLSRMAGLLISLIGVLLVLTKGQLGMIFRTVYNVGDLLMLAVISVAYSLLGRRIKEISLIAAIAVSALLGLFVLVFFLLTSGNPFPLNRRVVMVFCILDCFICTFLYFLECRYSGDRGKSCRRIHEFYYCIYCDNECGYGDPVFMFRRSLEG
nr:DMT family transporter [Paenibacillus polymyxa]